MQRACKNFIRVPQGSILGLIIFNIFLNDYSYAEKTDLHNFADDNTSTAVSDQLADLTKTLETEGELSVGWFKKNEMVVNSGKFQTVILGKKLRQHKFVIDNKEIKKANSIKLLGINIDNQLKLKKHCNTVF